jgi:predicted PhzF superfamily epimerase YddE/YHI9
MSSSPGTVAVHVLRVFCDDHDDHGNPLGIVLDGAAVPSTAARQEIAYELGFSETVFVDHARTGSVRIFTPEHELQLAGHPLVGTAWFLAHHGTPVQALHPPAGAVTCGATADAAWIEADPTWGPPWQLEPHDSPDDIDAIDAAARPAEGLDYAWAWIDEAAGVVRARCFVKEHGIIEDEATGSAALLLGAHLGRPISIHQGRGSRIAASPTGRGTVRVEGRVVLDDDRLVVDVP